MTRLFVFAAAFVLTSAAALAQTAGGLQEQPRSSIGYSSVATALQALRALPGATVSVQAGWTIVDDKASHTLWSFSPESDPAYPAAVRRQLVVEDKTVLIKMDVLCEATKEACDKLVVDFQKLNDTIKQHMNEHH
jgi:hypothetical protein